MAHEEEYPILPTQPPSPEGRKLVEAFAEEPAKQAARYDDLAKEMMKLLLGVPGVYLAVLKFASDQPYTLTTAGIVLNALAFAGWGVAAFAALRALFPRAYNVMRDVPYRVDAQIATGKLTIEEFYRNASRFKATWLAWSTGLFFAAVFLAALSFFFYEPKPNP